MSIPWLINRFFHKSKLVTLELKAVKYLDKIIVR